MDPRDRADQALARARSRRADIVTPETAESPMDAQNTVQIPRSMVRSSDGGRDPNSTVVIDPRAQQQVQQQPQTYVGHIPGQQGPQGARPAGGHPAGGYMHGPPTGTQTGPHTGPQGAVGQQGPGQQGSGHQGGAPQAPAGQGGAPSPGYGTPPGGQPMTFGGPPPVSPAPGTPQINPAHLSHQGGPNQNGSGQGSLTQYVAAPQFTDQHTGTELGTGQQQAVEQFGTVSHLGPGQHFGPGQPDQPGLPPTRPHR